MTTDRMVYLVLDGDLYRQRRGTSLLDDIIRWLKLNGVRTADVLTDYPVTVEGPKDSTYGWVIRYSVFSGEAVDMTEERVSDLLFDPPMHLLTPPERPSPAR